MRLAKHLAALAGFAILALLYTYPLVRHFSTLVLGLNNDESAWLWYFWHFRHAVQALHSTPLWTDMIYWPHGANMLLVVQGHYFGMASYFLQPLLGQIATYNFLIISALVLSGYGVFLIAFERDSGWGASFAAGALYAFAPDVFHGTALDFTNRQVVPFFAWGLLRAIRTRKPLDCLLAAFFLTWAWGCNYYFFLIAALLVPFFYVAVEKPIELRWVRREGPKAAPNLLLPALAIDAVWVVHRLRQGQIEFHGGGSAGVLIAYVAPYAILWALCALFLLLAYRPEARLRPESWRFQALFPYAATMIFYALLNLPLIATTIFMLSSGDYGTNPSPWRGGGNPTDIIFLLRPNPLHPLWGDWAVSLVRGNDPGIFIGYLPLAAAAWLWRRPRDASVRLWFAGLAAFCLLPLGPWLKLFGWHTYLPLPFYFLHLLPLYNNLQTGYRLFIFPLFFLALIFAAALKELSKLRPSAGAWISAAALGLIAVEFARRPFPLHAMKTPAIFERLGRRPDGAMLPVPAGATFGGTSAKGSLGNFVLEEFHQTAHHKPYIGGQAGRMPYSVRRHMETDAFLTALFRAQAGDPVPAKLQDLAFVGKYLRQAHLRYILVHVREIPPALRETVRSWPIRLIDEDRDHGLELYEFPGRP